MVRWFQKKTAFNQLTKQQIPVWVGTSDWDDSLHPTLVFEYFKDAPIFNMFMILFPKIIFDTGDELMDKLLQTGQDARGENDG